MDPSYNNSQNGVNAGGSPVMGAPGGVQGGMPSGVAPGNVQGGAPGGSPVTGAPGTPSVGGMSYGSGDIILNSGGEKKRNKWMIAAIAAVAVAIIVAVIALIVFFVGKNNSAGTEQSVTTTFNRYVNYFWNGEAKNDAIEIDASKWEESYFNQYVSNGGMRIEGDELVPMADGYLDKLVGYYGEFYDAVGKYVAAQDTEGASVPPLLDEYYSRLNTVKLYYSGDYPSFTAVLDAYVAGGVDGAKSYIDEIVGKYKTAESKYDIGYVSLLEQFENSSLALIQEYDGMGCIDGGVIDYGCVIGQNNARIDANYATKNNANGYMIIIIRNSVRVLGRYLPDVQMTIGGGDE